MKTTKVRYNLADLVAQCDPVAPVPEDVVAWDRMTPVGQEIVQALGEKTQPVVTIEKIGKTIATMVRKSQC